MSCYIFKIKEVWEKKLKKLGINKMDVLLNHFKHINIFTLNKCFSWSFNINNMWFMYHNINAFKVYKFYGIYFIHRVM